METLALVLTAITFGAMAFFSFVVAPLVFAKVPEADAGRLVRALFPIYYLAGATLALAAGVLTAGEWIGWVLLTVAVGFLWLRFGLLPAVNQARDLSLAGDAAADTQFDRLHRLSVLTHSGQLLVIFAALVGLGLDL